METIITETRIAAEPAQIWSMLSKTASMHRLAPPELQMSPVDSWPEHLTAGAVIQFNIRTFGFPVLWACEFVEVDPPHKWVAQQRTSPFRFWQYAETLYPAGNDTIVEDCLCYAVAGGSIGSALMAPLLAPKLKHIITYRQQAIRDLVETARASATPK